MKINGTNPKWGDPQAALRYAIANTDLPPDCFDALEVHGGPAIRLRHDAPGGAAVVNEICIADTYLDAAKKIVEFVRSQQRPLTTLKVTKLNRAARRRFDAKVRKKMSS